MGNFERASGAPLQALKGKFGKTGCFWKGCGAPLEGVWGTSRRVEDHWKSKMTPLDGLEGHLQNKNKGETLENLNGRH